MSKLVIEPFPRMYPANHVVCRARISYGRKSRVLWFRLPIEHKKSLTDSADSFLLAALLLAMSYHCDIHIKGTVSPSLAENLHVFQNKFIEWWPNVYSYSRITADNMSETRDISDSRSTVVAFSGGIDSSYSLYRHVRNIGTPPYYSIKNALMVHGFDIPLQQPDAFNEAFAKAKNITDSLDISLIPITTNMRQFPLIWIKTIGMALASVMTLFARTHSAGLIASSHQLPPNDPQGSHHETDPLLSSNTFQIIHDAANITKLEKLRALKSWPEFIDNLRVCWEGPDKSINCGHCEKCIRTIIFFRLLGIDPVCFSEDVTDKEIREMYIPQVNMAGSYRLILEYAREHDISESWVTALAENMAHNKSKPSKKKCDRMPFSLYEKMYRANVFFNELRSQVPRYDE